MAFPAVTNVTGSNPGPQSDTLPDTVQLPTGNIWKIGYFNLTLTPVGVGVTTATEQTFAATGIGLLTTDFVYVNKPAAQASLGIVGARVSAADTLALTYSNQSAATITPTAAEVYKVMVLRVQPNWSQQATGNQLDW